METNKRNGKLILVGAGPGDPELISIKGMKALKNTPVILYDALVHPALLDYAPNAEKIYVGKRAGQHYSKQEEINALILQKILEYGEVVRLKGGDPFIFGRGQEEIDFVVPHNIEVEVIPGISSVTGIPALHQIPLTKRGTNESLWIVTGTTASCKLSEDIAIAAASKATVVIVMGMNQLENIITIFQEHRDTQTPVAIIQNGSFDNERTVVANIGDIVQKTIDEKIGSPALIVIGEVVKWGNFK